MNVATSLKYGNTASAALAENAVRTAMQKINLNTCNSVLLFLSSEFANDPQPAIKAAARAANCTQVVGCTATGIFTEEDWVIDAPAVAVMVFGGNIHFQTHDIDQQCTEAVLTIAAPSAINSSWLNSRHARYGGVSGDALGQGAFSVWQNAKGETKGLVEGYFSGVRAESLASHGLQLMTIPHQISHIDYLDLTRLKQGQQHITALQQLETAWRLQHKDNAPMALHKIMAVYADSAAAIHAGDYQQTNVISTDDVSQSVTLTRALNAGQWISWAIREPEVAITDLQVTCDALKNKLPQPASFGLLFSCLNRGPYFYNGVDRDLETIKTTFPTMPLIGFYGNGAIIQGQHNNQLLTNSAVLSIFGHAD